MRNLAEQYLNNVSLMKNGQVAVITGYRNANDIDVTFEDGTEVQHKTIHRFKTGLVENPNYITVSHIMSTAETLVYISLKEYFPDIVKHWSADKSWGNSNVDMYIPSLGVAIEIDEYATHRFNAARFDKKQKLIENCEDIKKLYTLAERGCKLRHYEKNHNYQMDYDSHNFSGDSVSKLYKKEYFLQLELYVNALLSDLGVNEAVVFTRQMIKDVMSKKTKILSYSEYWEYLEIA